MEVNLSPDQKQAKHEQLERGAAFEELIRSNGWKLIQGYYQNRVVALTNGILAASDRAISEFEDERRELVGIKKLFAHIDSDIKALENERNTNKPTTK